jgi:large subunit ribosomal protein L4
MLRAKYFNAAGEPGESFELPEDVFDGVVHEAALHQVIKAYLANQRQGNAATKTRSEVAGGKHKPWRQKGTGRARQGSIRAPHWRGGGVAFGPTPRSYHQAVPKKVKALARRSAFNTRALADEVAVIERFELEAPKTRLVAQLLERTGLAKRKVLLLTDGTNEALYRSARNLPEVRVLPFRQASAYDVMNAKQLVIEAAALHAGAAEVETEVANV